MTPSPGISLLLLRAEREALEHLVGMRVTQEVLDELAWGVKKNVLAQVLRGEWIEHRVRAIAEIVGLVVKARLGNQLVNEPPVVVEYDFAQTKLMTLVVKHGAVQ